MRHRRSVYRLATSTLQYPAAILIMQKCFLGIDGVPFF